MFNRSNFIEETKYSKKLKIGIFYAIIFASWMLAVAITGRNLIFGLGALMSVVTVVTSKFIPSDRDVTLSSFRWTMLGYAGFAIMMHFIILITHNDAISGAGGGNAYNFANVTFDFSSILIPLGFVGWQLKKFTIFYGGKHSKKKTMEYLKKHGNDGRK